MGLISLVNAIDRLLSVTFPCWYFKLKWHYAIFLSSSIIVALIPCYTASLFGSLHAEDLVLGLCNLQLSVTPNMAAILRIIRILSSLIAAILYIPIIICLRRVKRKNVDICTFNIHFISTLDNAYISTVLIKSEEKTISYDNYNCFDNFK